MVSLFVRRVIEGTYEYEKVPARYKDAVTEALKAKVASGELTQEKFDSIIGNK